MPFIKGNSSFTRQKDVDWLYLGGGMEELLQAILVYVISNKTKVVQLIPFRCLVGAIPQEKRPDDSFIILKKAADNSCQPWWVQFKDDLIRKSENQWGTLGGANTVNYFKLFAPWIEKKRGCPPHLIVDLGCGLGQTARSLAHAYPSAKVVGLDASQEAIDVARTKFHMQNLRFEVADFSDTLPFESGSVDLVVSVNALGFATNQLKMANEVYNLLAPDGLFLNLCRTQDSHTFWDFPAGLLRPTEYQLDHRNWALIAARHGFDILFAQYPWDFNGSFFIPGKLQSFTNCCKALDIGAGPGKDYRSWTPHALIVSARNLQNPTLTQPQRSYLGHIQEVIKALETETQIQGLTVLAWLFTWTSLKLMPEALDFMCACLPDRQSALRTVFAEQNRASFAEWMLTAYNVDPDNPQ
jgi:SAM-dependent methyltransferase